MSGVNVDLLRCPTCYAEFRRDLARDAAEPILTDALTPAEIVDPGPWYLTCRTGHRWTVKQFTRRLSHDEVLLGERMGG